MAVNETMTVGYKKSRSFSLSGRVLSTILCALCGVSIWFMPAPVGVDIKAWHLFAVFIFTVLGLVVKFTAVGSIVIFSMTILTMTNTLTFAQAFAGFSNETVWLIIFAFFIARGFVKTGLGLRVAYQLMSLLGKSTLGMAYGMALTDFILAPAIPSVTARSGGIVFPVVNSLARAFGSDPETSPRYLGSFLIQTVFQCTAVSSAMFLTAMAGNPMIQSFAAGAGVDISWSVWALAGFVPGIISLILIPLAIYKLYPPEVKQTPKAKEFAKKRLQELGAISSNEWILIGAFFLLIALWTMAPLIGMSATITALFGFALLIGTNVLSWEDVLNEKGAWDTLVWFACLFAMATALNHLGFMQWFSDFFVQYIHGFHWIPGFAVIALLYFYSHYLFASNIAHITTMYAPLLLLSIGIGTPPGLAALMLGFFSSLFGPLTTYGCGPAPIYFGSGYVDSRTWWKLGWCISVLNIFVWGIFGTIWWWCLGLFSF